MNKILLAIYFVLLSWNAHALELAGVKGVAVKAMPADEWPSPTKRPAYSVLRHYALELQGRDDLPEWEDALADFLKRMGK